jgi:hypothetical protein
MLAERRNVRNAGLGCLAAFARYRCSVPTTPPPWLLDRDAAREAVRETLAVADPMLTEVVNYGGAVLARWASRSNPKDHDLATLFTYRHLLDMVDAIHLLVREGASAPARLQLRAAFEALLAIQWITKADTERRAYAYLARDALAQIAYLERLRGSNALPVPDGTVDPVAWIDRTVTHLHGRLQRPGWCEAHTAFVACRNRIPSKRDKLRWWPQWYAIHGGPADLAGLAGKCGRTYDYDLLYRAWSDVGHGTDITWQMTPDSAPRRLRSPLHFKLVVSLPVEFVCKAILAIADHYGVPSRREAMEWYWREVEDRLDKLEHLPVPK